MKVFISWSGARSHSIAMALRVWLPLLFRGLRPFVSSEDIDKGARWASELDKELDSTDFGIICLTRENLDAPWLMYEAGALAKSIEVGSAATVLLDVGKSDLKFPLARFQATTLDRDDMLRLVKSINARFGGEGHSDTQLQTVFEAFWPQLEADITDVRQSGGEAVERAPIRSDRDMLEELIATVRRLSESFDSSAREMPVGGVLMSRATDSVPSEGVPILRAVWVESSDPQGQHRSTRRGETGVDDPPGP